LQFKITIAATVTNLGISLIAISLLGAWDAISANLIAEAAVFMIGLLARRHFNIFWHPVLPIAASPLVCSAAMALAIAPLPRTFDKYWWIEFAVGTIVLAGCLVAFERALVGRVIRSMLGRQGS
jgi:putative polysaccharide biosynthesis protein